MKRFSILLILTVFVLVLLAQETPGIPVFELAELLNLDPSVDTIFAEKVVKEEGVHITFDTNHRH